VLSVRFHRMVIYLHDPGSVPQSVASAVIADPQLEIHPVTLQESQFYILSLSGSPALTSAGSQSWDHQQTADLYHKATLEYRYIF